MSDGALHFSMLYEHHRDVDNVTPILNEMQQTQLWETWIGAETRALYFGGLVQRFRRYQFWLTVSSLVLSSGAAVTLLASGIPSRLAWLRAVPAVLAAVVSAISLASNNEKNAIDAADLNYRWTLLAQQCSALWSNMYSDTAHQELNSVKSAEADISKSSTVMPNVTRLMLEAEKNVVMHHGLELAA